MERLLGAVLTALVAAVALPVIAQAGWFPLLLAALLFAIIFGLLVSP